MQTRIMLKIKIVEKRVVKGKMIFKKREITREDYCSFFWRPCAFAVMFTAKMQRR